MKLPQRFDATEDRHFVREAEPGEFDDMLEDCHVFTDEEIRQMAEEAAEA